MNDPSQINDRTDYYELIGVDENATDEQLKKAYRKAAMKWHPDRNHDNVEEATRVFQIIEHAYSILSDPHERAWYDGHRNLVVNEFGEFSATNVDIESLFSASAFSGYSDGPKGFYAVFGEAFCTLSEEENSKNKAPLFGDSKSSYEKVSEFYNFWTCFTTKRSFAFKDIYHLKDAPNSRYKRAMNQENEKARQKAQRDFVQSVRELALFAKKRDPRVKKHLEEVERMNEEKRQLAEKKKIERQKEVEKQLQDLLNDESGKISFKESDIIYLKEFDNDDEEPQWHCEYCGRDMNTESAFRQHCNTKKHKKLSAVARKDFLADPSLFEHTKMTFMLLGLTDYEIQAVTGKTADEFEEAPKSDTGEVEEEEEVVEVKRGKNKKKQQKKNKKRVEDDDDDIDEKDRDEKGNNDDVDDDDGERPRGKNKNKNQNQNQNQNQGKGKNGQQNQNNQNQNNQQKITKKEKHKQKMQRMKEERQKAELEELEKQRKKEREEKEQIVSILTKSQSGDKLGSENASNDASQEASSEEKTENFGQKLSKKEKKRLRQLEEARMRLLLQEAEEEEEEKAEAKEGETNEEEEESKENEEAQKQDGEVIEEKPEKKVGKVIEIIDENGKKVKVTMTDDFDEADEKAEKNDDGDDGDDGAEEKEQNKEQLINKKQKGKNKKFKGPKKVPPGMFMCRKCHAVFPSKTKLFKHLEETNHATAYG